MVFGVDIQSLWEPKWYRQTVKDLKRDEGLRLKPYQDTVGVWTIGYGHTKGVTKDTAPITEEQAEEFLKEDLDVAVVDAKDLVASFDALDSTRKTVVANMSFNLGRKKLSAFVSTIKAINNDDYVAAALHMTNTKWAKQVKGRADRLIKRMLTGEIEAGWEIK